MSRVVNQKKKKAMDEGIGELEMEELVPVSTYFSELKQNS